MATLTIVACENSTGLHCASRSTSSGKSNRREWNEISFAGYHRYTAASVIHF
jgi:hypothetical protein